MKRAYALNCFCPNSPGMNSCKLPAKWPSKNKTRKPPDKAANAFWKSLELKYNLNNSSIISSFYTLQFISPKHRQETINKIYNSLNWGGAFFFVEKTRASDARFQDYLNQVRRWF